MNTLNLRAEEIFYNSLIDLGNETKRRLIELLASSLTFKDTSQESDKKLLQQIAGAWKDDGLTAEEEIAQIREARTQETTRHIVEL